MTSDNPDDRLPPVCFQKSAIACCLKHTKSTCLVILVGGKSVTVNTPYDEFTKRMFDQMPFVTSTVIGVS